MKITIPPPAHWQDFELLCRDLFAAKWGVRTATMHGSSGQNQDGVDFYAPADTKAKPRAKRAAKPSTRKPAKAAPVVYHGVQCKLREQHRAGRFNSKDLRAEIARAKKFKPGLVTFTVATTAPRDKALQKVARQLSTKRLRIDVLFWEDLSELLDADSKLLAKHYGWARPDEARRRKIDSYLASVHEKLGAIPLAAIYQAADRCPQLEAVYTSLDTEQLLLVRSDLHAAMRPVGASRRTKSPRRHLDDLQVEGDGEVAADTGITVLSNPYLRARTEHLLDRTGADAPERDRRLRAIEFLAAHQHAVLVGPAGSGKSAFASFVALCLAHERRGNKQLGISHLVGDADQAPTRPRRQPDTAALRVDDIWPHGALLPLYVELRKFTADTAAFPSSDAQVNAGHLLDHLCGTHARVPVPPNCVAYLREELLGDSGHLTAGAGVLLLLDGLDETPEHKRVTLKRVILAFTAAYPRARVLVTSRPKAYHEDAPWYLKEFESGMLAKLDPPAAQHFVRLLYVGLGQSGVVAGDGVAGRAEELAARIAADPRLWPMAERPLTLTLLTHLHASGRMRDGGRAAVYEQSVQLLFDRWNRGGSKDVSATGNLIKAAAGAAERDAGDYFYRYCGLDEATMLEVLREVAMCVHRDQDAGDAEPAAIPLSLLMQQIGEARKRRQRPEQAIDQQRAFEYLDQRAGLLLSDGDQNFRFPHRTYQEFLAAEWFCQDEDFPSLLAEAVRARPQPWAEVLGYCVLIHAARSPSQVWSMVDELVADWPAAGGAVPERERWLVVLALSSAIGESEKLRGILAQARSDGRAARCGERLRKWLVQALVSRTLEARLRIEAGEALGRLGDPRIGHRPENFLAIAPGADVALGRFLVTVSEYAEFVAADGYARDGYWKPDGGLMVRKEQGWTEPADFARQREHPNRPVVGVSWYEASAYCRWRSEVSGEVVRLPTHEERRLVGSPDGRRWPWGNEPGPTAEIANYGMNVGRPTPVGCYPLGAGAGGHLDLGGSVWEWACEHKGRRGADGAAIWGGSWHHDAGNLRAGVGLALHAGFRHGNLGFRVVAPASR